MTLFDIENSENSPEYVGFGVKIVDETALSYFYAHPDENVFNCLTNQYVCLYNDNHEYVGSYRWNGDMYIKTERRQIRNKFVGKIKAKNQQQHLALDMLYNDDITVKVLAGKFGSGKTFLMCSAAFDIINNGSDKFTKIVFVRNNIEVKDSKPIGHLPGSYYEKMAPYCAPIADHVGGVENLERLMAEGKIEVVHLGFIRGRDIKNSIVLCSEAENLTKEHMQLLISRIGRDSALWIDGDVKQVDMGVFENNNGMSAVVEKLKGHPRFGYVKLQKTERSETAAMADLLD